MKTNRILVVVLVVLSGGGWVVAQEPTEKQTAFFESRIRPLLAKHCYRCHSQKAKRLQAGLFVDSRDGLLKGGDTGTALVPGHPEKSLLITALHYNDKLQMPPRGKLPKREIDLLTEWVKMGAPWPNAKVVKRNADTKIFDWNKARKSHWAWRPVKTPTVPKVRDTTWPKNAIDHFVLAKLETKGMEPSPPAARRTLIRRAYFDLIGLPPSPKEVRAFVADESSDAFGKVVDHLLSSPHYGERWGRHWLDVARHSDGFGGFLDNKPLPHAWKYRDWVVAAFNRDLPYDEFIKQQIAGDLMQKPNSSVAPGFFAVGPTYRSDGGDPDSVAQAKSETLDDRVDTMSRGLLGLTVSCARCHDHKFDPIPTLDYYSLAGVFNNTRTLQDQKNPLHTLKEAGNRDMRVALRGNLRKPGKVAPRRFLRILSGPEPRRFTNGSGRLELAQVIANPDNPLTSRVMVNRIWLHHFGKAIVRTPSNFGTLGEAPTHPKLLDWLADHFVKSGWSIKTMHRTIMLSATYQMSSAYNANHFRMDGDNKWLWRYNLHKLDAEAWRDTLLAVTGELDRELGGQPVTDVHSRRRTLYFKVSRNGDRFATDELLRLFDFPLMRATIAKRPRSIVPQQYLFLMNSKFMADRARALARRLEASAKDDRTRIENAYQLLFSRKPLSEELRLGVAFLQQKPLTKKPARPKQPRSKNDELLIADFEGNTYGDWKTTGQAFGSVLARGTLRGQMVVSGFLGRGLVNSFYRGDGSTGTLTSPPLEIKRRFVHFLIGGGNYPGKTCMNLIVSGKVVRTATGPNNRSGGSEQLSWKTWDVSDLMGKQAIFQIVDQRKGGWGHINIDHIFQSNRALDPKRLTTKVTKGDGKSNLSPLEKYTQVLLSSNEFFFVR
ncbi:MAG: PSD1 and planctomycete cytochrome C domain-containing protein [Gemmataceae bacterium]